MNSNLVLLHFFKFLLILSCYLAVCAGDKSVNENREDTGESNDETNDTNESLGIDENEYSNNSISCTRRQNSQLHEIRRAQHKQFPFMAAIMSQSDEYLCAGTVVSNGLILTSASCTMQPAKYVLVNTTKARKDETTAVLHIIKTEKFSTYDAEDENNIGIIFTEKHNNSIVNKIQVSNMTSARNIVDLETFGFGLNSELGVVKDLQYIGLERRQLTSADQRDLIKGYFDCVDTKIPTCFKDVGGPAIFDNELIGVVIKGQYECTREITATYALNKKIAEILPTYTFKAWLDERIKKNEEAGPMALVIYPIKPARRNLVTAYTAGETKDSLSYALSGAITLIYLFC